MKNQIITSKEINKKEEVFFGEIKKSDVKTTLAGCVIGLLIAIIFRPIGAVCLSVFPCIGALFFTVLGICKKKITDDCINRCQRLKVTNEVRVSGEAQS